MAYNHRNKGDERGKRTRRGTETKDFSTLRVHESSLERDTKVLLGDRDAEVNFHSYFKLHILSILALVLVLQGSGTSTPNMGHGRTKGDAWRQSTYNMASASV